MEKKEDAGASLRNSRFVDGLFDNMTRDLDKYVMSGSPRSREGVYNVLEQIESEAWDPEVVQRFVLERLVADRCPFRVFSSQLPESRR